MDKSQMIPASTIMKELEETMLFWLAPDAPHDRFAKGAAYGCARIARNLNLIRQSEYKRISDILIYGSVESIRRTAPHLFQEYFENEAGFTTNQQKKSE